MALAGLVALPIILYVFLSPFVAIAAWVGWVRSDQMDGGLLFWAIASTVVGIVFLTYCVVKFRESGKEGFLFRSK